MGGNDAFEKFFLVLETLRRNSQPDGKARASSAVRGTCRSSCRIRARSPEAHRKARSATRSCCCNGRQATARRGVEKRSVTKTPRFPDRMHDRPSLKKVVLPD